TYLKNLPSFPTRRSSDLSHHKIDSARKPVKWRHRDGRGARNTDFGRHGRRTSRDRKVRSRNRIRHIYRVRESSAGPSHCCKIVRSEEHTSELQSPDHLVC